MKKNKELKKIEQQQIEKNFKIVEIKGKTKKGKLIFGKEYNYDEWHKDTN